MKILFITYIVVFILIITGFFVFKKNDKKCNISLYYSSAKDSCLYSINENIDYEENNGYLKVKDNFKDTVLFIKIHGEKDSMQYMYYRIYLKRLIK